MQSLTAAHVASLMQSFVEGTGGPYDWDDFVCGGPVADPALEVIRARCASLPDEFPPEQDGHYCSEGGLAVMRTYIEQLRSRGCEA